MLLDITSGDEITRIPHVKDFERWKSRLSKQEYRAIVHELNSRIEGDEVHTSSWIPGSDWNGTVFQPIWSKACKKNQDAAALFFGLILWVVMMERPETWAFGRYELEGIPIKGLTYFRVHRP